MRRQLALVLPLLLGGLPTVAMAPASATASVVAAPASLTPRSGIRHTGRADRDRQPTARPPVGVDVDMISPARFLTSRSTLRLRGQLRNESDNVLQRVTVRLRFGNRLLPTRGEVEAYSEGKTADPPLPIGDRLVSASLQPGARQTWALSIPVSRMGLRSFGVYPIEVEAYGPAGALGKQRTFVTFYPTGTFAVRTKISWVWPIIDQPHRAGDATFADDRLKRQFAPSGRLTGLVGAAVHTPTPLTWLVDPALIDDTAKMTGPGGYTVGTTHHPSDATAGAWLTALRGAVGAERLVPTPYADPDVMALAQHGRSKDIRTATAASMAVLTAHRMGTTAGTVAMPPDGLADQHTMSALVAGGYRTVMVDSTELPDARPQTFTQNPVTHKTVGGTPVTMIAADDTLTKVLATNTRTPTGALLARQRFLAETAMITGEAPGSPRTIVVSPPRRWNPDPTFARDLLAISAKTPWLRPVPLKNVEALHPVARTFLPPKTNTLGLSRFYLHQVTDLSTRIKRFDSIFQPEGSGFGLGVLRAESSAWNNATRRGVALRRDLESDLDDATGKIRVLNDSAPILGKSAPITVTISNGLDQGRVFVRLHAYSQNSTRLRVDGQDHLLVLDPGHKDQVALNMKSSANGVAYVNLELLAPDGRPFGRTQVLTVRATGYGPTALLIVGVSLAVLSLGVAYRFIKRRKGAEETGDQP